MNSTEQTIITQVRNAGISAERAYWQMKGIDRNEAQRLDISAMVQSVLDLLQQVDNITMDIVITIKQQSQCR